MQVPLWIVGAGPNEAALKAQAATLGLTHLVHFKGRLESVGKQQALQNCRFLVMPSRQETFGLTALEAMASSKPVIAYNIDHLNELLQPPYASMVALGNIVTFTSTVSSLGNIIESVSTASFC